MDDESVRVILVDFDKTCTEGDDSWVKLNAAMGVTPEIDLALFNAHYDGMLSYRHWLKTLEWHYKENGNHTREKMSAVYKELEFVPGLQETTKALQDKGIKVGILSASLDVIVGQTLEHFGFDFVYSCNMAFFGDDGYLTHMDCAPGKSDIDMKLNLVYQIQREHKVKLHQIACLGDGFNERLIFEATQKGITFPGSKLETIAWRVIPTLADLPSVL